MADREKKISIRDIAERTGISKSVVSLALADRYGVNAETRNKVVMAALEMGYDFNKLQIKKRRKIVLMIYHKDFLTEAFWGDIIKHIESALYEENYVMSVQLWRNRNVGDILSELMAIKPQGLICLGEVSQYMIDNLNMLQTPIIVLDPYKIPETAIDCVKTNNITGGYSMAKYIDTCGHKKICFLGNVDAVASYKERHFGFHDYFKGKEGYTFYDILGKGEEQTDKYANFTALKQLLTSDAPPTVIACANDRIAYTVYDICKELQLKIPNDVSVMGFDNAYPPSGYFPALTTVNVDKRHLAEVAVEAMLKRIQKPDRIMTTLQIATELIIKDSVRDLTKE